MIKNWMQTPIYEKNLNDYTLILLLLYYIIIELSSYFDLAFKFHSLDF